VQRNSGHDSGQAIMFEPLYHALDSGTRRTALRRFGHCHSCLIRLLCVSFNYSVLLIHLFKLNSRRDYRLVTSDYQLLKKESASRN
jgi:hypothetical protein